MMSGAWPPPAPSVPAPVLPRLDYLDRVRGLAVVLMIVDHLCIFWASSTALVVPDLLRLTVGRVAMPLFFVLSGFLITGIIVANRDAPGFLACFYARRGLRIWPIYYLTVAAVAAAGPALPRPIDWASLPNVLSYTQYVPRYWGGPDARFSWYLTHTWTLAIEERSLRSYEGGWAELIRRREEVARAAEPPPPKVTKKSKPAPVKPAGPTALQVVEADIERQEAAVADLERQLAEDWGNADLLRRHRAARDELKALLARWEQLLESSGV